MSIKLRVSNSLSRLSENLSHELADMELGVFLPVCIVTQTEGMNSWLKQEVASKIGIAANLKFLKPNDLIHQVYRLLGGKFIIPLTAESHSWLLFNLLGAQEFKNKFKAISSYFSGTKADSDLKRMSIAEKVADLFDQYQIYRPEIIAKWNKGTQPVDSQEAWQHYLWTESKKLLADQLPDKTEMADFIFQELKKPHQQQKLQQEMPGVQIFGLSVITKFHIELFHAIGSCIDLTFHLLNPAPEIYWFDDRSAKLMAFLQRKGWADRSESSAGNVLLTTWGKVIRNTFELLFQSDEIINDYESVGSEYPGKRTLLQVIQSDIFENLTDAERLPITEAMLQDGSITINSCFTPAREVEVLYNYLVHLIDIRKESISARDVVVMVSDIDVYAPYIKAVFSNAPYKFPFSIADERVENSDSIVSALEHILQLTPLNFKAEEVLQLLDSSFIRSRFGISDINLIRSVVNDANIRFGIAGNTEDDTRFVSWKYGLKRIMYGLCMNGEEAYQSENETIYPLDRIEGQTSFELIRFQHFIEVLTSFIEEREQSRSVADWAKYIEETLYNLVIDPDTDAEEDLTWLLQRLEQYVAIQGVLTEPISYLVFAESYVQTLSANTRSSSFAMGGITFCSLIPMRSIPFKVVALLGLNFDKFPRKENPLSFNLMEFEKKKGDRNVKDNDKHLFLETLLSAKKYFYLSYIGQNANDNTHLPPSSLVDEFMDYLQKKAPVGLNQLVQKQPLHSFSKLYTSADPKLYNYLDDGNTSVDFQFTNPESGKAVFESVISTKTFIAFFKHPVKVYFNNVLEIYYNNDDELLAETELFELDSLQTWGLKEQLLTTNADELSLLTGRLLRTGRLPLKNSATVEVKKILDRVEPIQKLVKEITGSLDSQLVPIEIVTNTGKSALTGSIKVFGDKLIVICWSKSITKYQIEGYIQLLMLSAMGVKATLYFIEGENESVKQVSGFAQSEALQEIEAMLEMFVDGHVAPIAFWSGLKINWKKAETLDFLGYKKQVLASLNPTTYELDPYVKAINSNNFLLTEEAYSGFMKIATLILKPIEIYFK